ncbi:hypothetical protein RQP46_002568 [Phenoliferia psychrophenolica]
MAAKDKEIKKLEDLGTWSNKLKAMDLPSGAKALDSMVAANAKVATFAPVAKFTSIRLLVALAGKHSYHVHQADVDSPFVQARLDPSEAVCMKLPEGMRELESYVGFILKLNKALYGLRQSARLWSLKHSYIGLYVDEVLLVGPDLDEFQHVRDHLHGLYGIKDLGQSDLLLGIRVTFVDGGIHLSVRRYLEAMIERFSLTGCKTLSTPMETNLKVIGCLLYTMLACRPDICFAVSYLSRFTANPSPAAWNTIAHWAAVTNEECRNAIFGAEPHAAQGPDKIPPSVLQALWPAIEAQVCSIYRACLRLGYHPTCWKEALALALRKNNKPDYSLPNAYRPIALLCCLGKGLEKLVATRLGYLAEFAGLLPPEHFGGRPGRSCEDALHVVVDTIKTQWRLGNYVVAILLDVKGAYPNTTSARLQANLRRRGVPEEIVAFVASFMEDRTCRIILEGKISPLMPSDCGLPQGSPLSPILYLFYNADLLAALRTPHSTPTGWVDDTAVIVYGPDPSEVSCRANLLMGRVEMWCGGHDSDMDAAKSHVIPLPRPSVRSRTLPPPPIFLNSIPIPISEHAVLLGVTLDSTLSFHHHVSAAVAKASKAIGGIARLVTSTKGISAKFTRQLVVACAYTRSDYASTLWYTPDRAKGLVKELSKIQRPALKLITGGFRNTALSALEYESFLLPTNLRLLRRSFRFTARLRTISPSHPLFDRVQLLLRTPPSTYPSPLSITLHSFPSLSLDVTIEQLRPSAVSPWEPNPQPPTFVAEPSTSAS